jgi:hypothetical protein
VPAGRARPQREVPSNDAIASDAIHFFQKKTFAVGHELMPADAISSVGQGISITTGEGEEPPDVMFHLNGTGMLPVPWTDQPRVADALKQAMRVVCTPA